VGTGKTTLVQALFKVLEHERVAAGQLVTTQLQADELLRMVAAAFGLPFQDLGKAALLSSLEGFFRTCQKEGRRVLLVVDEAQNLPPRALEELRMLSNYQAGGRMLLQTFLLGQKEFRATMRAPSFEQLRQRVIAAYHLKPLSVDEVQGYVEHRLRSVGWRDDPRIVAAVFPLIHEFTGGIPRRVNTLCDRLLLHGCLEELHQIGPDTLATVTGDIISEQAVEEGEPPAPAQPLADWSPEGPSPADTVAMERPAPSTQAQVEAMQRSVNALVDAFREELVALRQAITEHKREERGK
jgi:type II secretory pathway predicted ATPase ExeA